MLIHITDVLCVGQFIAVTFEQEARLHVAFSCHIRPILDFCSTEWGAGYAYDSNLIEFVQRKLLILSLMAPNSSA